MKIASWNVNSLKVRMPHLEEWLALSKPDIVALQEIKMETKAFPVDALRALGYESIASGQKTYNGVALLARAAPTDIVTDIPGFADEQRRVLAATVGDLRIVDLYVVNRQVSLQARLAGRGHRLAARRDREASEAGRARRFQHRTR